METIRQHALYIILALIGGVILWVLTALHLSTGEYILPFLNKRGWLDMPFSYYAFVIVLGCALLVLQVLAITAYRQHVRWKEVRWLEKLAKNHTATMKHLVSINHSALSATAYFSDTSQFVVFNIPIVNRSIYTLTLGEVEKQFTFEGKPLPNLSRIESIPDLPQVITAKNTAYFTVNIAQQISRPIVERIQSQGGGTFGAHNISIKFFYHDYTDTPQTVNVNLDGTISFSLTPD
jgi:hypothetical protein